MIPRKEELEALVSRLARISIVGGLMERALASGDDTEGADAVATIVSLIDGVTGDLDKLTVSAR